MDFLRARARSNLVSLTDDMPLTSENPDPDLASVSFRTFMELPVLASVRGHFSKMCWDIRSKRSCRSRRLHSSGSKICVAARATGAGKNPRPTDGTASMFYCCQDQERRRLEIFVAAFKSHEFDVVRQMLADDVRLDLVNHSRRMTKKEVEPYFTGYENAKHWRFALGAVDGQAAMLVFDSRGPMDRPAHFVALTWQSDKIAQIKDFLFAAYAMQACDWVLLRTNNS